MTTTHTTTATTTPQRREPARQVEFLRLVDFKWMMAGQGWWVDLTRLQRDPGYAGHCIASALTSDCHPLRSCATDLQACFS
ncbi:hypothetical protein [Caldimonas brevitalea]|uniref:Uncharacterized protein n=1 Tax=Caldimonas brevitalea TaxID=413882 RepID=A0A0G3BNF1_9BURK|nr:hypothetical protein [Caldimonas brevitalea]AKJ28075.1 hypothetical protein AAW51_1384 [Caldimonas brevitalea]